LRWQAPASLGAPSLTAGRACSPAWWSMRRTSKRVLGAKRPSRLPNGVPTCCATAPCGAVASTHTAAAAPGAHPPPDAPGQERARGINRLQAVLEDTHSKLAAGVTEIRGVAARALLEARIAGQREVDALADLARGRLRATRDQLAAALQGYFPFPHRCLVTEDLSQIDSCDDAIDRVRALSAQHLEAEPEAVARLDTMPGVSQRPAESLLAELGTDLTRLPRAKPLASWAGMCPGNDDSGGKRLNGRTRKGNR
jgi:transposase